jgi:hypothetical protein
MRKDDPRVHIIYRLHILGETYVGVTAMTCDTVEKSVRSRAAKHFYRAKTETKDWAICQAIRKLSDKMEIVCEVVEVLQGKSAAHKREVELRRTLKPTLNTDVRGDEIVTQKG